LNFSSITDKIIHRYFKDLEAYFSQAAIKTEAQQSLAKDVIRRRLCSVLRKHQDEDILLIAHSMGSIISYDVLTRSDPKFEIDTFMTIGSPLGLPVITSRIFSEQGRPEALAQKVKTPDAIRKNWFNFSDIEDKVAVGMVGLLSGLQWDSDRYYPQMSFGLEKSIPGVWVRPSQCERVRQWARKTNVEANLSVTATTGKGTTANVYAVLPGQTDEYYLVFSQHDTYFDGAVQDASGVAVILALAKHFANTKKPLKRGIIFMSVAHTNGRVGERDFIKRHQNDLLAKTALVIAVEHIGLELDPQPDLRFKVSERPSFRMFFTALNQNVNGTVKSAVLKTDFRRSVIVPQWLVEKITGKARGISAEFHEIGLPVIGFMSNPPYMFFPEDTMSAVAVDQLVPTANLMATILRRADAFTMGELR